MEYLVFLRSLFKKLSLSGKFFSTIVLRKRVKSERLRNAIIAAGLSIKTFLIQQKKSLDAFSVKLVKMRCGFQTRYFHSLGGAYLIKTVLKHKIFSL